MKKIINLIFLIFIFCNIHSQDYKVRIATPEYTIGDTMINLEVIVLNNSNKTISFMNPDRCICNRLRCLTWELKITKQNDTCTTHLYDVYINWADSNYETKLKKGQFISFEVPLFTNYIRCLQENNKGMFDIQVILRPFKPKDLEIKSNILKVEVI